MKTLHLVILSVAATFILIGCSSKPTESTARDLIQNMIQSQSNGLITLVSFTKTNGISLGDAEYRLEYSATIQFQDNCLYGSPWSSPSEPFGAKKASQTDIQPRTDPNAAIVLGNIGRKGQSQVINGVMGFQKTENGWRLVEVQGP
ncbi:MAG: hypothetical protein JO295_02975 [Verrucomicrobia bacterium]|nr:hypothetical protein [Verrucomicrobiota bacterium]